MVKMWKLSKLKKKIKLKFLFLDAIHEIPIVEDIGVQMSAQVTYLMSEGFR